MGIDSLNPALAGSSGRGSKPARSPARRLFEQLATAPRFIDFLTLPADDLITQKETA